MSKIVAVILSCSLCVKLVLVDVVFIRFAQWTRRRASRKLGVFLPAYQGLGIQVWPVG